MSLLEQFQQRLGIQFHNTALLKQAFTHSSYVNEHNHVHDQDNERLEYLGDAVLELTVSEYIFQQFETMSEGEMTKLRASIVCESSLYFFAKQLEFGSLVLLGKGEESTGGRGRPALLADVFEAFIGALYLDQGLSKVHQFMTMYVFPHIATAAYMQANDYKSELQEFVQQDDAGQLTYAIVRQKGPAHNREFSAVALLDGREIGSGQGRSKKVAEQKAAYAALHYLQHKEQQ